MEVKEDKSEALAEELVPNRPFFTPARDASLVFLFPGDRVDCFSRKSNLFVNLLANRVHLFLAIASVKPYIYIYIYASNCFWDCWLNQHIWACRKLGYPETFVVFRKNGLFFGGFFGCLILRRPNCLDRWRCSCNHFASSGWCCQRKAFMTWWMGIC